VITIHRADQRGHVDHGWLDTRHTFSFGDYRDPERMGFRVLRVLNEDRVRPGEGFGTHPHRDMEIISWVLEGTLSHRDSTGGGGALRPGEVQRMSAGTGVTHSEFNGSREAPLHFLQVWILPDRAGHPPSYEQLAIPPAERRGTLRLIASPDGAGGSATIHQDARVYVADLAGEERVVHRLAPGRHAWVQVASGEVALEGRPLGAGDGAALSDVEAVALTARGGESQVLLFDLP
jgi:redox-sensitive bicupin YhaK (pirin superfamily)